jgi:hypothetical protein
MDPDPFFANPSALLLSRDLPVCGGQVELVALF